MLLAGKTAAPRAGTASPLPTAETAFLPLRILAQGLAPGSHTHESITRKALIGEVGDVRVEGGLLEELFPGAEVTNAVSHAIAYIVEGNAFADVPPQHPPDHFDGEQFTESQARLKARTDEALDYLRRGAVRRARWRVGLALHAIQDFYAHGNYAERYLAIPAPQLVYPFPAFTSAIDQAPCDWNRPEPDTPLLTTGYTPEAPTSLDWKCHHGGALIKLFHPFSEPPLGIGINKDTRRILFSPNADFHDAAARLAEQSTVAYIRGLEEQLRQTMSRDDAREYLAILLNVGETVTLESTNQASSFIITLDAGRGEFVDTAEVLPLASVDWRLPDVGTCTTCRLLGLGQTFEIKVTGESSVSATGLAGYALKLPPTMEFVEVWSDRGTTTKLSGREHYDLFVLRPFGGQPHRVNTYKVRRK